MPGSVAAQKHPGLLLTHLLTETPPTHPRLYVFDGFVDISGTKQPLDANNLLLRGSTLRKTPWAIGLAVNVGREAKIVQNMTKAPRKVRPGGAGRWCS